MKEGQLLTVIKQFKMNTSFMYYATLHHWG